MKAEEKHFGPVWFIPGENYGKYPHCHSIYIEGAGILIDPSSDRERLSRLKGDPGVNEVWLSHSHEDHLMHLDLFDDLPLCTSEQDAPVLSGIEIFMDALGIDEEYKPHWRPIIKNKFHFRPRKTSRFLENGQVLHLGSVTVEVIHTPGHTPGHLAFFFREQGILFMGDYDLTSFGPWYGDLAANIEEIIASVNRLKAVPAKLWFTSHEKGILKEAPPELWSKYLRVIEKREQKLIELLEKPRSFEDIVKACIIYHKPREPKMFFELGERLLMAKHLERLMNQGVLISENNLYIHK